MISAEQFARQNAVWHQSVPTLEQFTRWANRNCRAVGARVYRSAGSRSDLVAETAFMRMTFGSSEEAAAAAKERLQGLPRASETQTSLSASESAEAEAIAQNIADYVAIHMEEPLDWSPKFAGCGRVRESVGDLATPKALVEIKAVERPFRGLDFRQALTYCALAYSVGRQFSFVSLLNPRLGVYFASEAEGLALDMGAGSWVELMQDLVDAMSLEGVSR